MKQITNLLTDDLVVPTFSSDPQATLTDAAHQANEGTVDEAGDAITKKTSRGVHANSARALGSDELLLKKTLHPRERLSSKKSETILQTVTQYWNDDRRRLLNSGLRSALFTTAGVNSPRANMRDEVIASLSNYVVTYSGTELRQDDLSVCLALFRMGRNKPHGAPIYFKPDSLIKNLGWRVQSDTAYEAIKEIIQRLKFTSVKISSVDRKSAYAGSIIRDYHFDETDARGNRCWTVRFEDVIARLFLEDTITLLKE